MAERSLWIPEPFARTTRDLYGEAGDAWLARLPGMVAELESRWELRAGAPFELSYNWVAAAERADGTPAVLKLGFPDPGRNPELVTEREALRLFAGRGMVRLLEAELERGALLLERLEPGTSLAEVEEDRATEIAAGLMQRLWRPAPAEHSFPTVARWGQGLERLRARFDGGTGPLSAQLVEEAERVFVDLPAASGEEALLHGDLHHLNILAAGSEWRIIDPKGLVGDPGFEVGAFLHNPPGFWRRPDAARLLARRVDRLADLLGWEPARVRGWGLAQAMLSACWSVEDHGEGWEGAVWLAELLAELPG